MKVAIVGAGAIGGVVAAAAAASGNDVTICVRTPIDAVRVERDGAATTVAASILTEPAGPPSDVVFVTVKAMATESTAPFLAELCGPTTLTVVVQNGLDQAARVADLLPAGAGPAAGALAYLAAERVGPGVIRHRHGDLLFVPEEHAEVIGAAVAGGLRVRGSDDWLTDSWRKLLSNIVANPITAILLRRIDLDAEPDLADLGRHILTEAIAVAQADGARIPDTDVERVLAGIARLGVIGSSMLYDRQAGQSTEHGYLTGEVVRRGAVHGIATPVNTTVLALLDGLEGEAVR